MANNPYVNKVVYGNNTVMDISDTTATPEDVLQGQTFYLRSGQRATGTAIGGIPEEELRDTVGWTGKNLLQIPNSVVSETKNGITFTVYRDNSGEVERININGTASADTYKSLSDLTDLEHGDYTLSKGSNNADAIFRVEAYNNSTYVKSWGDMSSESKTIDDVDYDGYNIVRVLIKILSGKTFSNVSIYPMLRKSSVTDADYEPYHASVESEIEQIYSANGVLGAKNLLPIEVNSRTIQSVVFTVNADGSISANGTASPEAVIWDICTNLFLKAGTYILTGCPEGASASTYELLINNSGTTYRDYGDGVKFTLAADTTLDNVRIIVRQGAAISNKVFYPMLRLASDSDDTYVPYAMTNRELTKEVNELSDKMPFTLIRYSVTESSGNQVRIPAGSDIDSRIKNNSVVIPLARLPIKYSMLYTYDGYVQIRLAEDISDSAIGILVMND